jgi:hypothetical protein
VTAATGPDLRWVAPLGALVAAAAASGIALAAPGVSATSVGVVIAGLAVGGFFFASRRVEVSLAAFLLYLGLGDGFLRLWTGIPELTLVRDALLLAIVAGAIIRALGARSSLPFPPLTGWIVALVALALVQVLNPENQKLSYAVAAIRPHVEFIPLFFFGYLLMRTPHRLRVFLGLLLVVAVANGIVGFIQFNLTQEQLASWGPGFRDRVYGDGVITGRFFLNDRGVAQVRPMGLGSDVGFSGSVGTIAAPAALALLVGLRRYRDRLLVLAGLGGIVLAILSSQTRLTVVSSIVALAAFAALGVGRRRAGQVIFGVAAAALAVYVVVMLVGTESGLFQRYRSIAPTSAIGTTISYRAGNFETFQQYLGEYPFGAGLGTGGPAVGFFEGRGNKALDSETEFNFLLIELGIPGLLLFLAFTGRLLWLAAGVRRHDGETRLLLAAVAAPLFAIAVAYVVATPTTSSPSGPYLWFAAGVLAYWCLPRPHART